MADKKRASVAGPIDGPTGNSDLQLALGLGIGGAVLIGGLLWWASRGPKAEVVHQTPEPSPPPPPPPSAPTGWYASAADRDQRIATATAAAKSGDPAKLSAALAKLSPEDRAKLEQSLPHL